MVHICGAGGAVLLYCCTAALIRCSVVRCGGFCGCPRFSGGIHLLAASAIPISGCLTLMRIMISNAD